MKKIIKFLKRNIKELSKELKEYEKYYEARPIFFDNYDAMDSCRYKIEAYESVLSFIEEMNK